jgi:Fe-S cluster assembly protein SufD
MTPAADVRASYLADFERLAANGGAAAPPWLRQLRQAGIERFAADGFPNTHQESWRFTDVSPIARTPFPTLHAPKTRATPAAVERLLGGPTPLRLVFLDGVFEPGLSSAEGLAPGVKLASLGQIVTTDGELLAPYLGRYADLGRNPFTALSTAFIRDGAFVLIPAGLAVTQPIYLVFLTSSAAAGCAMYPRTVIVWERDTSAAVVEVYASLDSGEYLSGPVTEMVVGQGARARHLRIQRESDQAFHMATSQSYQARDSDFFSTTVALGARLSRHDINAVLDGPGAQLLLNGLSILGGQQHVDHHTTIEHAQPHGESHELFNGIFDGQAHGVFTGRIIVRPGAQRTDSKQTNNNLLLSEDARADSQPQLEIYADDVKCTHGATIGPLDPNGVFYLQTRGIGAQEARQVLTYGFAADVVARLDDPDLRQRLDALVRARLGT